MYYIDGGQKFMHVSYNDWSLQLSFDNFNFKIIQKNSCFIMWSIVRLYIKLGPSFKSFFTGLPHGPFWIYSRFFEQMVFVHFDNGELVPENVVLVDEKNYHFAVKVVTDRSSVLPFCPNRTEQVNQSSVSRNQTELNM